MANTTVPKIKAMLKDEKQSHFTGMDFSGLDLSGFDFSEKTIAATNFSNCSLRKAKFNKKNFS